MARAEAMTDERPGPGCAVALWCVVVVVFGPQLVAMLVDHL
jgi:hypothetical protein